MFKPQQLAVLVPLACASLAQANDTPQFRGDDVVVTASRVPEKVRDLPANVTVISAEDIANSSARTVQDLLANVAGVHVFNETGAADQAVVDLRGFGMTGRSNTLILIDGIKQNTNDLSAPNLSIVPLAEIERIEVVRGSGAVAYGGGATGGVVNIITRSGFQSRETIRATATVGSYNFKQLDVAGHVAGQNVALDGYVKSMTSDGYRANNAERNDSGGMSLSWRHDGGDIKLYARSENQDLRLPGARQVNPVTGEDQFTSDPHGATTPHDYTQSKTDAVGLQARQEVGSGMLLADVAQRSKRGYGYSSGFVDQRDLDELNASLRYEQPFGPHRVVVGVDTLASDLDVNQGYLVAPTPAARIKQRQLGGFIDALFKPWDGTSINLGGRNQHLEDQTQGTTVSSSQVNQELHAWQLGARQHLNQAFSVYAKAGQSFRVANADEQFYVSQPLKPQTSHDKELGLEWSQGRQSLRAAWFRYDLTNEIHFNRLDGWFGSNVNLDPTRRQGLELEGRSAFGQHLELTANLTWQQATFRSGSAGGVDLAGNDVPMVPHWLANVGLAWQATDASRLGLNVNYVGKQRMDNDQANQFEHKLGSYTVVNARLTHVFSKQVEASLDVFNLFDRKYATYGIRAGATGSNGIYDLYPATGRTMQASVTVRY
ncbi:MAG TPA: TonB-dependent receptor [Chromobacteriaceae bacterium]|nr:TonB-dependent receptor [Chromobacteriaceae bacterium]